MDIDKVINGVKNAIIPSTSEMDIVELIFEDHRPLKDYIAIMKNVDKPLSERREAAENFAIQLVAHAKPEELVLYKSMKGKEELRLEAFEGETEHGIADQLLEEIKRAENEDVWSAKVKVLAELVEHHILEEETMILPDVRDQFSLEARERLGADFLDQKSEFLARGADDAPHEDTIEIH